MSTLITEVHADCFACGLFETIFRDPIPYAVYTQLHKSLCMWEELCTYTKGQINHEKSRFQTFQIRLDSIVNFKTEKNRRQDTSLRNTHLLLIRIGQSGASSHLKQPMGQKPKGRQIREIRVGKWPRKSRS